MIDGKPAALILFVGTLLVGGAAGAADPRDVTGASDPDGLPRFPHSWIVDFADEPDTLPRELVVSAVERTRRELHADRLLRFDAARNAVIYEMPQGTPRERVVAHYRALLAANRVFTCHGRDCGRSNQWANQIFGRAILYGPDANQHYMVADFGGRVVTVYVVERGNKRVYAHVQTLWPTQPVRFEANLLVRQKLAGNGYMIVDRVQPRADGTLDAQALEILAGLREPLGAFEHTTVYVVCHLYGRAPAETLVERSGACAERAVAALRAETGPQLVPFAAGAALPRPGADSRIELVLPNRHDRTALR